ncbi:hypothetical protein FA13DRAFT_1794131 [Coprinellus micaceus]|uniref:Uncharacterized protein n=1 Tax=Coprinellus micaceus TaxID=71717 RepID=A0A4Y7T1U5_COPMI|nr:hypothetical protein FA13DRAFT_1794131 [Coprinellus micaceus]
MAEVNHPRPHRRPRPRPHKIVYSHHQAYLPAATIRSQTHSSAATLHSHPHDFSKGSNRTYTTFASPRSTVTIINGDLHGRLTMAARGGVVMTFSGAQVNVKEKEKSRAFGSRERGRANIEISTAVAGIESVVDTACDEGDSGDDEDEDDWEDVDEDEERGDSCGSDNQWETEYGSDSGEDEDEDEAQPDEDEDEDVGSSEWEIESDVSGQSEYGAN